MQVKTQSQRRDDMNWEHPKWDEYLVKTGVRQPHLVLDKSVHTKTKKEKDALKQVKLNHKNRLKAKGVNPKKQMNVPGTFVR